MAVVKDVAIHVQNRTQSSNARIALFTERKLLRVPAERTYGRSSSGGGGGGGNVHRASDADDKEYTAWMILNVPSDVSFAFPFASAVRSSWYEDGTLYRSGPFDARMGSTWSLVQISDNDCPILEHGMYRASCIKIIYSYLRKIHVNPLNCVYIMAISIIY